jgi:hypothetical protein
MIGRCRRSWGAPLLTVAMGMVLLAQLACSTNSSSTSTSSRSYGLVTSRWPPGIEAVVLRAETGLYVVGSEGVRWASQTPPRPNTTTTARGWPVVSGLDGQAVSERFVAYVDAGKKIVVRSMADGTTLKRMPFESQGHTSLRALSDDGTLLALVTVNPELEARNSADQVPWTITVVNVASGTATVANALAAFVSERMAHPSSGGCMLVALDWLPGGTLLVGVTGRNHYETYLHDPVTDTMELMPDVQHVGAVGPAGMVLGENFDTGRQLLVWRDGAVEPVIPDAAWQHAGVGAISADGTALVLWVSKTEGGMITDAHGWQRFVKFGSEWRPSGPAAQVDWMNQPPSVAGGDGRVALGAVYQSTGENHTVLLSHDFETGKWEEWFGPEDLQVDFGSYYFAGIIPE